MTKDNLKRGKSLQLIKDSEQWQELNLEHQKHLFDARTLERYKCF